MEKHKPIHHGEEKPEGRGQRNTGTDAPSSQSESAFALPPGSEQVGATIAGTAVPGVLTLGGKNAGLEGIQAAGPVESGWQTDSLERARSRDEEEARVWKTPWYKKVDEVTSAEIGSMWARTLPQYTQILSHAGAPNIITYARENLPQNLTVVDAGSGAGYALVQMRDIFPQAALHGIDVRNAPDFTLMDRGGNTRNAGEVLREHGVAFHQDTYLHLPELVPGGYDVLLSVGAFYDTQSPDELQLAGLQQFYDGLKTGGIAQVLLNAHGKNLDRIEQVFGREHIPFSFHPGKKKILMQNVLNPAVGVTGTMTLGPKK